MVGLHSFSIAMSVYHRVIEWKGSQGTFREKTSWQLWWAEAQAFSSRAPRPGGRSPSEYLALKLVAIQNGNQMTPSIGPI